VLMALFFILWSLLFPSQFITMWTLFNKYLFYCLLVCLWVLCYLHDPLSSLSSCFLPQYGVCDMWKMYRVLILFCKADSWHVLKMRHSWECQQQIKTWCRRKLRGDWTLVMLAAIQSRTLCLICGLET
jgi:hypothetical protein